MPNNNFFSEELRDGYLVDTKMKKVWAAEIDILKKFIAVCDKYGLQYFLSGGTLLGAVRHKGFIPWDDDIDVDMLRSDYEKLIEIAASEFTGKYFFQTVFTDKDYFRPHVQIRNSDTTAILNHEKGLSFNQGIFIDIFPLDSAPKNKLLRLIHSKIAFLLNGFGYAGIMINPKFNTSSFKILAHYIAKPFFMLIDYHKYYMFYEKLITLFNSSKSEYIGEISLIYDNRFIYKKEWFSKAVMLEYEDMMLNCPIGYKEILKNAYGDYMKPVKGASYHGSVFFDTENSYKQYLQVNSNDE